MKKISAATEKTISKMLSLALRHNPKSLFLTLDKNGWAEVAQVLNALNKKGHSIDFETLEYLVKTNDKQRFAFDETFTKIRANQGHSINIDMEFLPQEPPFELYHGTSVKFVESILKEGLTKQSRQFVHLSHDKATAQKVGERRGKAIIFKVKAKKMHEKGFVFFRSENGVWLTDNVPVEFLERI